MEEDFIPPGAVLDNVPGAGPAVEEEDFIPPGAVVDTPQVAPAPAPAPAQPAAPAAAPATRQAPDPELLGGNLVDRMRNMEIFNRTQGQ